MEVQDLSKILLQEIDRVLNVKRYKHLISRDNNLARFDVLNRILIEYQSEGAFDVRTADEWDADGREIRKGSKPIYILMYDTKSRFFDADTHREIDKSELSCEELQEALRYGIVYKDDDIENIYTKVVFDVRQTKSLNNEKYNNCIPKLKTSDLVSLLISILNCSVEHSDDIYYSKGENKLFINKNDYNTIAVYISDILIDYYISRSKGVSKLNTNDMDLLINTIKYSLNTIFHTSNICEFDSLKGIESNNVINVLNIADSIVYDIVSHMKYDGNNNVDAVHYINVLKKAEALVNIMESNAVMNKMKGV